MTKFLYSLIATLLLLIAFLGGYLFRQKNNNLQTSSIASSLKRFSENSSSKKTTPKLERISSSKVLEATNTDSGNILYIEKGGGKIIQTDPEGQERKIISGQIIENIDKVLWSPKNLNLIYYLKTNLELRVYNFDIAKKIITPLHRAIKNIVFSPDGDKIVYNFFDSADEEGNISISRPDGSDFKNIFKTRLSGINIDWPKENILSFYKDSGSNEETDLFLLDINGQKITKILDEKKGLAVKWSKSGDYLLYSFFDFTDGLHLVLRDLAKQKEYEIPSATFATKCTFGINEKNIYCGVPLETPRAPIRAEFMISKDKIEKWNLETKESKIILEPSSYEDIQFFSPFVSPLEDRLFFINLLDNRLYRLNI